MIAEKEQGFVVGISSPSGGGKTTVACRLVKHLGDAVVLSFDEYDEVSTHPTSYQSWLTEGADYNAWQTPRLATDLQRLKHGLEIASPLTGCVVSPAAYIVFDAPLGRAQHETGQHIDFMVYIDTPLDVAMARRILRDFDQAKTIVSAQQWEQVRLDLESYLEFGRVAYLEMDKQIRPRCDLILDELLAPDELAMQIVGAVKRQRARL
jgi:uridine kinase